MAENVTHYVPGNWGGRALLTAVCGERVIYYQASSTVTNCPKCKTLCKQNLEVVTDRVDYE